MTRVQMSYLRPDWPAPANVGAASTFRTGGVSEGPYASLNLGDHVGDTAECVAANRATVAESLLLPAAPSWLEQVHGSEVASGAQLTRRPRADGAVSERPGDVLPILTADCLPVLLCRRDGTAIGAAHAGWRSLAGGILENTVAAMGGDPFDLMAWLGPAIGPDAFEVGAEVRDALCAHDKAAASAFKASVRPGHYLADLFELARQRLRALGVPAISGGGLCTYSRPQRFFSYRRDGQCGRMATFVWLAP